MKRLSLLLILCALVLPLAAQERHVAPKRFAYLPPQLIENPDTHIASGLAQSPTGHPVYLDTGAAPRGSIVGVYGFLLKRNNVGSILLMMNGERFLVQAEVFPQFYPKLEMVVFRLPPNVTGEVAISAVGLTESNWVRFFVE
jgi:hypothetical protein